MTPIEEGEGRRDQLEPERGQQTANRVLGQGMISYTAPGADCDLGRTTAVDIKVAKSDEETGRIPNALNIDASAYPAG